MFLDGHHHAARAAKDASARERLRDLGFGAIAIKSGESFAERTRERPDVFGKSAWDTG